MIVDPVDRATLYSLGNLVIAPSRARTINAGAYLRPIFSGCTCRLLLDMAGITGPATLHAVTPSVDLTPRPLASGVLHLELIVKAATETIYLRQLGHRGLAPTTIQARLAAARGLYACHRLAGVSPCRAHRSVVLTCAGWAHSTGRPIFRKAGAGVRLSSRGFAGR